MESRDRQLAHLAANDDGDAASRAELSFLHEVLRLLPAGVTVQDADGRFLLMNDAAAAQLGFSEASPSASPSEGLGHRLAVAAEILRGGRPVVTEEVAQLAHGRQVLLTTHCPVRIADRDLLLSSSADISEQKAFEDQLFRSAFYDEL